MTPPNFDDHWDAGSTGCGELLLLLAQRMRNLPPHGILSLRVEDPGAPEDLPSWFRLTGHRLLQAEHPDYTLQRKDDSMAGKFCVSLTHAKDDTDRATVGFVLANAALASGKEVVIFLSISGVRLASRGYADDIHEEGFAPLKELMHSFFEAGGKLWVCSPCFKKRKLDEKELVDGAVIVGGARLVEFLSDGSPCVSY